MFEELELVEVFKLLPNSDHGKLSFKVERHKAPKIHKNKEITALDATDHKSNSDS